MASLFGLLLGQARDAQSMECVKTPAGDATVVVCRVDLRTDRLRLFHADAQGRRYQYIETLVARGIVGGYADGTFRPGNPVTRGQLTKFIYNANP